MSEIPNIVSFESLPEVKPSKQMVYSLDRDSFQILMNYLQVEHVPYYNGQGPHPTKSVEQISKKTGISIRTIRNYIYRLARNHNYNPYDAYKNINRAMTQRLEEKLLAQIENQYLIPGYYFNNKVLKVLALALWSQAPPEDRLKPTFTASSGWCRNFRKRHGYVWRRAKAARRPKETDKTKELCRKYLRKVTEIRHKLERENKLYLLNNMDETSWRLAYAGDLTWAKKGANSVHVNVNYNTKQTLTALVTVSAQMEKYPLMLLAKGKTEKCHQQFNGVTSNEEYVIDHSSNGWTTAPVMLRYLDFFKKKLLQKHPEAEGERIYLILDVYKAHTNEEVRKYADDNNIELIFIPAGKTDIYQPLDIQIFGALKGKARGYWYENYALTPAVQQTKSTAAQTLITCWAELNENVIDAGWKVYEELIQEEHNDDNVVDDYSDSCEETEALLTNAHEKLKQNTPNTLSEAIHDGEPSITINENEENNGVYQDILNEEDDLEEEEEEDMWETATNKEHASEDNEQVNEQASDGNEQINEQDNEQDNEQVKEQITKIKICETIDI